MTIPRQRSSRRAEGALGRFVDVMIAITVLLLSAIPLAVAAAAIKLTSRGPVFFRQERIGRNGKPFTLLKLRTMRQTSACSLVTAEGDTRVTRIGRWLRVSKFDEIPQFLNVVRGDMGIIGPRPEVRRFVDAYSEEERKILDAAPGLASMAQLVYPNEADFLSRFEPHDREAAYVRYLIPRKVRVDLQYERDRSIFTDLRLMLETALLVAGVRPRVDHDLWKIAAHVEPRRPDPKRDSATRA